MKSSAIEKIEKEFFRQDLVFMATVGAPHGLKGLSRVFSHTNPPENFFHYDSFICLTKTQLDQNGSADAYPKQKAEYRVKVNPIKESLQGQKFLAQIDSCQSIEQAQTLTGAKLLVRKDELPKLEQEYYWQDLIGLSVIQKPSGVQLGYIVDMLETGRHDVMVVESTAISETNAATDNVKSEQLSEQARNILIPWVIDETVMAVDLDKRTIEVDWQNWE